MKKKYRETIAWIHDSVKQSDGTYAVCIGDDNDRVHVLSVEEARNLAGRLIAAADLTEAKMAQKK